MLIKKTIVIILSLIILVGLASWSIFRGEKIAQTGVINGQKTIILANLSGIRLISESRGENSYQANYINETVKDTDLLKKMSKSLEKSFYRQGFRLEHEKVAHKYRVLDFKTKDETKNEIIKVALGYEKGQGTYFSFHYAWPLSTR
ncbi:hypothetical protein KKG58_01685 [Patescibacteria group bacterium]|nr:hypothetical protein [Patescibacteria group bacterium]